MPEPFIISDEAGRQHALDRIADLDLQDKRWDLTVKRHRERRSNAQNNLYHAWVDEVIAELSDFTGYEKFEVKKLLKDRFLESGREIHIGSLYAYAEPTTTTLTTAEMAAYMDKIYRWVSAEFGFALRLPPVMVEEGYDGPAPKQANGTDDDWQIMADDLIAVIANAAHVDSLEEITVIFDADLTAMEKHALPHYTRVMQAMERQGEELNRKDPAADSARGEPALEAG